tara:strand:- start:72331 stop:72963 length:633 start_codon:yes stop_codon:yes gene_type:complete
MEHQTIHRVEKSITAILKESLSKAFSYEDYRAMVTQLALENKTTGPQQLDELANYTLLNDKRMKRLDKTLKLTDSIVSQLKKIDKKITFLVLTESWCGDAAQIMPIMNKMAMLNANIDFKVVLRDENLELMNLFLTNGTLSIPKLVIVDEALNVIADWGPRPKEATQMVIDYKKQHGSLSPEFKQDLQMWYTKDKGHSTATDILACLFLE